MLSAAADNQKTAGENTPKGPLCGEAVSDFYLIQYFTRPKGAASWLVSPQTPEYPGISSKKTANIEKLNLFFNTSSN